MRKYFFVAVTLLIGAASCQIVETPEPNNEFTISISADPTFEDDGAPETKAVVRGTTMYWTPGDTLGVFPEQGSQAYFLIDTEGESASAPFDGGGWGLKAGIVYRSYYPLIGQFYLKPDRIPVQYYREKNGEIELQTQKKNDSSTHTSEYLYMYTDPQKVENDNVSFRYHHLWTILKPVAVLPPGHYTKLTFSLDDPLFVVKGYFDLTSGNPAIVGTEFENEVSMNLDISFDQTSTLTAYYATAPLYLVGKTLTITVTEESGLEYSYDYSPSKDYIAGMTYRLTAKDPLTIDSTTYAKASSITAGGTYLIVDAGDSRLFMGTTNGDFVNVSPQDDVITDKDGSLAGYEFTVEKSGNNYYLKYNKDGKYLICDYTNNRSAGLAYVDRQTDMTYPYALTTGNNGAFFFSTTQVGTPSETNQVLYFKSSDNANVFKIGGSGTSIGVHLYLKDGVPEPAKQDRGLSFNPESVTCTLGDDPQEPSLSGTFTTVTYSSSDNKVATVNSDGTVTPVAPGIVTITATAVEDDQYNAGSASYTLKVKWASTSDTYVRVTRPDQINLDGEYVIAYENGAEKKAFKPILNAAKNAFSTSADNAIDVTIIDNEMNAEEVDVCRFTLTNQDGTNKKFSLVVPEADGTTDYYLIVYGKESNTSSGSSTVFYASPTSKEYRSTFAISSEGKMTLTGNSSYVFRYSSGSFSASTSASNNLYLFVRSNGSAKQKQTLSFAEPTVTWTTGDGYVIGQSYDPQTAAGAKTTVTYSAEPESVAKIEGGKIKVVGPGSATITATAERTDQYYGASASYSLRIIKMTDGWVDLGSFSLENKAFADYLDDANRSYSDNDDATNSVMATYAASSAYSYIDRKDCPIPVTIPWANSASSSTVISIYDDKSQLVWTQNATAGATSADVYNLIPGYTYSYTVSEGDVVWEKGYFSTTGRRRMIKVSSIEASGHANNCRDLGGLKVTDKGDNKTIKYGYIFRGTNMDSTTDDEKSILTRFLNIGMDIDLRSGSANSPGGNNGNSNCYRPFSASQVEGYINPGFNSFTDLTNADKVKSVLTAVFNTAKSGKASYFHCYIGADRTGYIAMLIEGLLGVSEKDCSIDYELTSFSEAAGLRYRTGRPQDYYFRQGIDHLRKQSGDTFQDKVENYVKSIGITQDQIDEFKSIVLE